jgi:outer membrane protein assembly factor BamB
VRTADVGVSDRVFKTGQRVHLKDLGMYVYLLVRFGCNALQILILFGSFGLWFGTQLIGSASLAADWPRYRGPNDNGVSSEANWNVNWPESGPPVAWQSDLGAGYSSVAIADGRLYTLGNRENVDTVYCLDAFSGDQVWKHSYACPTDANEFEGGPTSTPTIDQGSAYTLSRAGDVFCFDAKSGVVKWKVNVPDATSIRTPGWGFSSSPWVTDGMVIVNVGDAGVALSASDGAVRWSSADKDSGYSSFVPLMQDGEERLVFGSARSYVCIDAQTGTERWRQRWLTTFGCNATNPIVVEGKVFLSSGYNRGSALLDFTEGEPVLVWKHKDFQSQLASSVMFDGFLYGANGAVSEGASLACLRLDDGKVLWNSVNERIGGLTAAGDHLITISDDGLLKVILPGPQGPKIVSKFRVFDEQCWTVPVLCNGRIYCRGASGSLVCLDVRQRK